MSDESVLLLGVARVVPSAVANDDTTSEQIVLPLVLGIIGGLIILALLALFCRNQAKMRTHKSVGFHEGEDTRAYEHYWGGTGFGGSGYESGSPVFNQHLNTGFQTPGPAGFDAGYGVPGYDTYMPGDGFAEGYDDFGYGQPYY
eukprot:TRINITY_DN86296_c0_g1_i1.p1 TRINITY_DN86296_c0_g1~~TRINITY_DN86296_c0_g1_i1.p1  ORF type:complete len:144 (+),score=11.44 TRINITY_DN86296_c0_g1_i1:29-460(+)